ncbi:hypothetical protein Tco_0705196 [Tanacetum coccineum]|uniref:Retrovirus-related Pol polyprotein from transposon TNT 1-94 n=1 Tax=Tanacetum coccineum TaxID=301880 RepID=A0ABQ4Y5U9_9ASTR
MVLLRPNEIHRNMDRSSHVPITSRPDIVHVNKLLWLAINEIDRENISLWLNGSFGTLKTPLTWVSGIRRTPFELTAFSDSDHAACLGFHVIAPSGHTISKSVIRLISWSSKKQDCTSMSSAEAEYVSLSACCAQVLWMRTQLTDYGFHFDKIPMYCDSKAQAICVIHSSIPGAKPIECQISLHKGTGLKGYFELFFVGTEYQLVDLFTKALSKIGLRSLWQSAPASVSKTKSAQSWLEPRRDQSINLIRSQWSKTLFEHQKVSQAVTKSPNALALRSSRTSDDT